MPCPDCNNEKVDCGCVQEALSINQICNPVQCDTEECSESFAAQCILYTGDDIVCDNVVIVTSGDNIAQAIANATEFFCTRTTVPADIVCDVDTVVAEGASVTDALSSIIAYFCNAIENISLTPGPQGDPGPAGADGVDGTNGTNGTNGIDGIDGAETIFINIPQRVSVTDPELIATIDATWFTTDGDALDIECIVSQIGAGGGAFELTGIPTGGIGSVLYASHTFDNTSPTDGIIKIRLIKDGTNMTGSIKFLGAPDIYADTDFTIPNFIGSGSYNLGFDTTAIAEDSSYKELVIKRSKKV